MFVSNEDEFWSNVLKCSNDKICWMWQGSYSNRNNPKRTPYGQFYARGEDGKWIGRRYATAHRIAYLLHYGEIPEGMWVLHNCGNSMCVNPNHLYLGTARDNYRDMIAHGTAYLINQRQFSD